MAESLKCLRGVAVQRPRGKILAAVLFFCAVQVFSPALAPAARVAGDDVPVPGIAPQAPAAPPLPEKRPVKKAAPVPSPAKVDKAASVPTPLKVEKAAPSVETAAPETPGDKPEPPVKTGAAAPAKPAGEAAPPAVAVPGKQAKETRYVTIDFDNVDIAVFVKFVSELTGKNFVIDEKVRGKVTIMSPRKISIDEVYKVFESVLEVNGFATVVSGDIIKIVPALTAREKKVETRVGGEGLPPEDRIVTQIFSLDHANPDDVKKILDPLISRSSLVLSYPPTGMLVVVDFLSNIRKIIEIIGALDVEGVAAQISYIPLRAASAAEIAKSLAAVFQVPAKGPLAPIRIVADERANAIILLASEIDTGRIKRLIALMDKDVPKGEAILRVYRLQNAVAEDLAKVLMNIPKDTKDPALKGKSPLISRDVQVVADKATNTLIITANKDDYRVMENVIKSLDVSRPMVYIEALVMEVASTKNFRVGVEWRALKDTGSISGFDTGQSAAFIGSGGLGAGGGYNLIPGTPAVGSPLSFPGGFSLGILGAGISVGGVLFPNIGAVIQAFENDTDVSILSTPQIMTLDNEEAEINVGKNVPYITRQENTSGLPTGFNYTNFEYKDVGVILNITPHINEDNFVRLKMNQKVTKVVAEESQTGLPTTLKREAKTTVTVKDRETIVIGGLLGDSTDVSTYQVPCLGNIPVLGWLYKSRGKLREKTNLYVFLTPHIIRTPQDANDLYREKRDEMGEVEEGVIKLRDNTFPRAPAPGGGAMMK